jgi:predicted outer membrane protein
MMNKEMNMKNAMTPAQILAGWKKIETANNASAMNDFQTVQDFANAIRKDIKAKCDSYKTLVIDTYLDCEYKKVKISKRVARVPKYARGVTK